MPVRPTDDPDLRTWLDAARPGAEPARRLESVYGEATHAIEQRGPVCWASGRCCDFDRAGHVLYVTGLEAAYVVNRLEAQHAQPDASATGLPVLNPGAIRGACPFQRDNLCSVHTIKPLACRTYFCQLDAQQWVNDTTEQLHEQVRAIHQDHALPYAYGEWRAMLARFGVRPGEP